jgi:DNA-binding MarR family transcriptional regulator
LILDAKHGSLAATIPRLNSEFIVTNARSLSRDIGVSYAAAHAAVERFVGRGLLLRHRNGVRQELSLSAFAVDALKVAI